MKKTATRILSLFLSVLLLFGALPLTAFADEAQEAEAYRAGVFQRYEDYYYGDNTYSKLINTSLYAYCAWADEIESVNKAEKAILWATHKLLGKELDKAAYIDYLTKLLALQEKGFMETLAAQSNYTSKADGINQALDIGSATLSAILDTGFLESINKDLKALNTGIDLIRTSAQNTVGPIQAMLVTAFAENAAQKRAVLETIRDNTEDKTLKEAAETMIGMVSLEFAFWIDNKIYGTILKTSELTAYFLDMDTLSDAMEAAGQRLAEEFEPWVLYLLGDNSPVQKLTTVPGATLYGVGKFVSALGCVQTGFAIGGAVMSVFVGDDVELFCEMRAMDAIGDALSADLNDLGLSAMSGSGDARYEKIRDLVAIGEALCYARLRGEYCAVESIRGKDTAPDNLDEVFRCTTDQLSRCYSALADIFPEREPQVIVTVEREETEEQAITTRISRAIVTMPGHPEIAEKITNGPALTALNENVLSTRESDIQSAREYPSMYQCDYLFYLRDAYATAGALSLQFMSASYYGGAHPISERFCYTFDLQTGDELSLSDILNPENTEAQAQLIALLAQALREELPALPDPQANIQSVFDGKYSINLWGFTQEGLRVTFSPYMIAAYAAGYLDAVVPYEKLGDILLSDYLPKDRSSQSFQSECFAETRSEIEADSSYTNFYGTQSDAGVTCAGDDALDVYIGEDTYNLLPIYRYDLLFYASYITPQDIFWLPETENNVFMLRQTLKNNQQNEGHLSAILISVTDDGPTEEHVTITP